ncbi:MAG: SDR family NAD(P)-dependent oxidoreductase [Proteiniphilum sp.]|nr:SDR family NAD(P)-dependent oxidoreductase [Proteiniphilum sp.]
MLLIKGIGAIMVGDDASDCYATMNMFQDRFIEAYKILSKEKNISIDEQLLKKLEIPSFNTTYNDEAIKNSVSYNKTIIVTGAAQGFGEGIARNLILKGANIVVADLNEEVGKKTVEQFNSLTKNNRAIFVKTDVSDMDSITNMVQTAVVEFGGIDTFISNAGVLRAGGLDDMSPQDFDFVTKINYNAYFYCTKIVSKVMKLQTKYAHKDYYADIIQINSKSGLRGSKANFAYAGGKFGGIGLTQSFALELAPHRIKVNSICPGNYYEGPLWSDPENGLFTQYLKAGKVPGAKTVEEVKAFYLAQVPMNKGCTPEDVVKAVLYLMDQCGETGQALPITGGQVMMS